MPSRPKIIAFDVIGTLFSLEPMRERLTGLGLPGAALELWFAQGLRDAFALAAADSFEPFRSVLESALDQVLAQHEQGATESQKADVLEGMKQLPAHADARDAFQFLADSGIRIMTVTNGAASSTEALLDRAGLKSFVERVVSVDEVKFFKPRPEVYLHAARLAGVEADELALVASHPWDVHGAKAAGLLAGFVAHGKPFPSVMKKPDVEAEALSEVARSLAELRV